MLLKQQKLTIGSLVEIEDFAFEPDFLFSNLNVNVNKHRGLIVNYNENKVFLVYKIFLFSDGSIREFFDNEIKELQICANV